MKKTIFAFIATLLISFVSFANTEPTINKELVKKEDVTTKKSIVNSETSIDNEDVCTITCSTTENGVTYTATSGNWFTSCNTAGNDCLVKLAKLTFQAAN